MWFIFWFSVDGLCSLHGWRWLGVCNDYHRLIMGLLNLLAVPVCTQLCPRAAVAAEAAKRNGKRSYTCNARYDSDDRSNDLQRERFMRCVHKMKAHRSYVAVATTVPVRSVTMIPIPTFRLSTKVAAGPAFHRVSAAAHPSQAVRCGLGSAALAWTTQTSITQ